MGQKGQKVKSLLWNYSYFRKKMKLFTPPETAQYNKLCINSGEKKKQKRTKHMIKHEIKYVISELDSGD